MKEILDHYRGQIEASDAMERLKVEKGGYFLVSAHREENVDVEENFNDFLATLNALAKTFGKTVMVSTHPRTRNRLEEHEMADMDRRIQFLKPLGFFDYVRLQMNAACVISDSGTISEESSILGFPAVTIRQAHERPEGMDEGTLIMCGLKPERVLEAIRVVMTQVASDPKQFGIVQDYDTDNVSSKVLRIILSYTDYVNRVVWRRP